MRDQHVRVLQKAATNRWRVKNPDKVKEKKKLLWANRTPEQKARDRERGRQWAKNNPEKTRAHGWRKQGLPAPTRPCPENCEICGRAAWLELRAFALDHDHTTGKFCGWLCSPCNTALGLLGDSREVLEKAIAYLGRT